MKRNNSEYYCSCFNFFFEIIWKIYFFYISLYPTKPVRKDRAGQKFNGIQLATKPFVGQAERKKTFSERYSL